MRLASDVSAVPPLDPSLEIAKGGHGIVYRDPQRPEVCIKLFHQPLRGSAMYRLSRLIEVVRWARTSDAALLTTRFAWPLELYGDSSQIVGYLMPIAPAEAMIDLNVAGDRRRRLLGAKYLMDALYWQGKAVQTVKPNFSTDDRITVLLDLAAALSTLHEHDLCYGDISGNNIAVRIDQPPGVFILDADSITTPELRSHEPLQTPDWETPPTLSPMEIDRSRYALFVTRLLTEMPRSAPGDLVEAEIDALLGQGATRLLAASYATGSLPTFDEVIGRLRAVRSDPARQVVVDAAVRTGFARAVLREVAPAPVGEERILAEQARNQVLLEDEIDTSNGHRYEILRRRFHRMSNGFALDIKPRIELEDPPRTADELHQLIYDARFAELARHLSAVGLDRVEADSWLGRAIARAVVEVPSPPLDIAVTPGAALMRFSWPKTEFINVAQLSVSTPTGSHSSVVERSIGSDEVSRHFSADRGAVGRGVLAFGVRSPGGATFFGPPTSVLDFEIPAVPAPSRTTPRRTAGARRVPTPVLPRETLLDPAELERRAREARKMRQRRLLSRVALAVGVVALGVLGIRQVWFTPEEKAVEPDRFGLSLDFSVVVWGQPALRWNLVDGPSGQAVIEAMAAGQQWERVGEANLSRGRGLFWVPDEFMKAERFRTSWSEPHVDWLLWPDPSTTGLSAVPRRNDFGSGVRFFWQGVSSDGRSEPESFLYRYRTSPDAAWLETKTSANYSEPIPLETGSWIEFEVAAVFDDGSLGEWVAAMQNRFNPLS